MKMKYPQLYQPKSKISIWLPAILLGICFIFYQNESFAADPPGETIFAADPCTAYDYTNGSDGMGGAGGIYVGCGNAANTEGIGTTETYMGGLPGSPGCFGAPTMGQEVVWIHFKLAANSYVFQFQIVPTMGTSNIFFELYYASPDCNNLTLASCGPGFSSWADQNSTVMAPFPALETDYYLAVWEQTVDGTNDVNVNFKSRRGCQDFDDCIIVSTNNITPACNMAGGYDVCFTMEALNGTYSFTDPNAIMTPPPATFGGFPVAAQNFCVSYPNGTDYNLVINEIGNAAPGAMGHDPNCYTTISGMAPVCCTPSIMCPMDGTFACNDQAGVNAWLNAATFDACGGMGTVTTNYNAMVFNGCGGAGNQTVTFSLNVGGLVVATCDRLLTVNEPALPVITCPVVAPIACTATAGFMPPPLGGMGDCGITWTATLTPGSLTDNSFCGGGGTLNWTYNGTDNCGRPLAPVACSVNVTVAPPATVTCPALPAIGCDEVANYVVPMATVNGVCGAGGNMIAGQVVATAFDACNGGTITVRYEGPDDCGRLVVAQECIVMVNPATAPVIAAPPTPVNLTCVDAGNYSAPDLIYNNNLAGNCNIMGSITPNVMNNWTKCAGGTIDITWSGMTACGVMINEMASIPVSATPTATVSVPSIPSTMSCDDSGAFTPPDATYSNMLGGACAISGTLSPTVTGMYNPCTGTNFSVTWTGVDECGRPLTAGPVSYFVQPAPAPTLTVPVLPTSLTCDQADAFLTAPDATYNNNAVAAFCQISGTLPAMITPNWDKCNGGTITVRYMGTSTACNHPLDSGPIVIPVAAAPMPTIQMPSLPAQLTCADAETYAAPTATYTNSEDGNCEISGFIFPSVTDAWSACGGKIIVTYMVTTDVADCGYLLQAGPFEIDVLPAPPATVNAPPMPTSLTCIQADNFSIGSAAYTNNMTGACNISGTIAPSIDNSGWTKCGGVLKVTYLTTDQCNNVLSAGPFTIPVMPAPEATVTPPPAFPASITCVLATGYVAPPVMYDNGVNGTCNISGTIQPSIANNFDKCGGNITITYSTTDMCGRTVSLPDYVIFVDPAPEATVTLPVCPTSISCEMAVGFMAQDATYTNGLTGTPCYISGSFSPQIENTWDKCGGTIKLTYISQDMCGRPLNGGIKIITVEPAPEAMVSVPWIAANISCTDAVNYMPPPAFYTNGLMGACEISGNIPGTVTPNFDKCGGTITINWTGQDMCGRPLSGGPVVITVEPAPEANVADLIFPTNISCEMATTFAPPNAPYTNGLTGTCEISGSLSPMVTPNWTKCGGTITVNYSGMDMCGRPLVSGPYVITVDPAPEAMIMQPNIPTNLSCEDAVGYMAPHAPYTNGLMGACEISGTVPGIVTPNFDKCGGDISITYNGVDECGRTIIAATFMITVDPAPAATIMQPVLPTNLSCADADGYMPPVAPYSNGVMGFCNISGTVTGVVMNNFDECGGSITVMYSGVDECGRTIIAASFNINVDPAPQATVTVPFVPNSVSCVAATTYGAPIASYNNGLTGVCEISGTINPVVTPNFDACGGTITITYNGQDDCGRALFASRTITVNPAPAPTLSVPYFPSSITCEESQTFLEHFAPYDNGLTGVCNISGWIQPVVNKVVDACNGGFITLTYNGFDVCGNLLSAPIVYVNVEPAPPAVLTIPGTPMMLECWEAEGYSPGPASYTNGLTGNCENSGIIYPTAWPIWDDKCEGGFMIISWEGYDDCGNHLSYPAFKVPILPDAIAPIGECTNIEKSFLFMYETPNPDQLDDYKYQIASNYWDYCSNVVVNVVGDTGDPVCGLDGKFERIYQMEVADECGNVADTCTLRFYGNCNPEYCTLSQSFYAGQWSNDELFGYTSLEILDSLLGFGEDSIHIGYGDCGFYLDDPVCVQKILQGEGTSFFIPPGYSLNCWSGLDNNLINQTIVTILNVRYNELFNNGLDFGNYQLSATCKNYPHHILDALPDDPTINDLIDYANDFLGCPCMGTCGNFETTPIAWDITCAFLALNSRFHECHVPGPCHLDNKTIWDYATPQMLESLGDQQFTNNTNTSDNTFSIGNVSLPDVIDFFPNPANEVLNIKLTTEKANTYRIRVLSTNGAEVLVREVDMQEGENIERLNIDDLDRGMYLLFIEGNDTQWSKRFVKMKK